MEIISVLGIIAGLIFLIVTAWKGFSIYICGIGAAIVVCLFSGLDVLSTLSKAFMGGFTTFVSNYLLLFIATTLFAKIMGDSGAAKVIAVKVVGLSKKAKPQHQAMVALFLLGMIMLILTYGGVNVFVIVFLMAALCKDIFKQLDIPWHLYNSIGGFGTATITVSMMPGTPSPLNLIPMNYLGTTATAAPVIGIVCSVVCFALSWAYCVFAYKRTQKRQEGFFPSGTAIEAREGVKMDYQVPDYNVLYCLVPSIILLVLMNIVGWSPITSAVIASVVALVMFHKTLPLKDLPTVIKDSCESAATTNLTVSCVVGFGSVVAATSGYSYIMGALNNVSGSPLVQIAIVIAIACGVCGSTTGGMTIGLEAFADRFMSMGVNPEVIHRVACIAGTSLDTLPHNAGVLVSMEVTALTYKQAYIHTFITCCVIPGIVTVLAIILASFGIV